MTRALAASLILVACTACSRLPDEPLKLDRNVLTVDNRTADEWRDVEIWLNHYYRATTSSIPAGGRFQVPLDAFVAGFGQRFDFKRAQIKDLRLKAHRADGQPVDIVKEFTEGGLAALKRKP